MLVWNICWDFRPALYLELPGAISMYSATPRGLEVVQGTKLMDTSWMYYVVVDDGQCC